MKKISLQMFAGLLMVLVMASATYGEESVAASQNVITAMRPLPEEAKESVNTLLAFASTPRTNFSPCTVKALVDFICKAAVTDSGWELPKQNGAAGSAYIVTVKVPLMNYLALNFDPGIPDYAVFPSSLRYSACLNSNDMQQAYACIATGPTGPLEYVTAPMTGMEEIGASGFVGGFFESKACAAV